MYNLKIIKHSDVTHSELEEIIKIKSVAWSYSFESQIKWINENLADDDFHVILFQNNKIPVAYLNLVEKIIRINENDTRVLGVGNVCSLETGKGYGSMLMSKIGEYFMENNKIGFLLCKKRLIAFYLKMNWCFVKNYNLEHKSLGIYSLIYNFKGDIRSVNYSANFF